MTPLLWVDVETSGLDPKTSDMLEIALVATNEHLDVEATTCFTIRHEKVRWNPLILQFHRDYDHGLLDALQFATLDILDVEDRLLTWVGDRYAGRPMAGSSPHCVDRPFLEEHMPHLLGCFHRRHFDVRTIYTLHDVDVVTADRPHRALADIMGDIRRISQIYQQIQK